MARVEEEVAAVEPRWQRLRDLPYFSHLRVVTEGLSPGARALEIGRGTAETGFFLGSQYGLDVYGIDVATHAVEVAAARFDRGGLGADRLSVAVIEELPFDDDTVVDHVDPHQREFWVSSSPAVSEVAWAPWGKTTARSRIVCSSVVACSGVLTASRALAQRLARHCRSSRDCRILSAVRMSLPTRR